MEKVMLFPYDIKTGKTDREQCLTAMYNPGSYSVSHSNQFNVDSADKAANRATNFTFLKQDTSSLTLELLFDTYVHGASPSETNDVRESLSKLKAWMQTEPEKHTPPCVQLAWNSFIFVGVIVQLQETYTMFLDTGKPVRAKASLTIQGCEKKDLAKNPNNSPDRTKQRVLMQNETLWDIAAREYGSPENWRQIALANGIENPRRITAAQLLLVPALPGGES